MKGMAVVSVCPLFSLDARDLTQFSNMSRTQTSRVYPEQERQRQCGALFKPYRRV